MKTIMIDVNAVLKTAKCVSDDDTRMNLQAHRLEKNKTITTDGRTMMIHEANNELEDTIAIRLPVNEIKKACRAKKSIWLSALPFEYEEGKEFGTLSLPSTNMRINCPIEYAYPDYKQVIPKYEDIQPCNYGIDPELLAQFGEPVYCFATGEEKPIIVFPCSRIKWMGVIMPMKGINEIDTKYFKETYSKLTERTIEEKTELKTA